MPNTPERDVVASPDIKAAIRKLQDAAWNCGTDEYRDGVSDAACTRRYDVMDQARADCVAAADALIAKVAALCDEVEALRVRLNDPCLVAGYHVCGGAHNLSDLTKN